MTKKTTLSYNVQPVATMSLFKGDLPHLLPAPIHSLM